MPRISDDYTGCAVYLYSSQQDAKDGASQGGSGFVVQVPSEQHPEGGYVYVVTNRHVIIKAKTPVIRMNRKDGGVECFETQLAEWTAHPDGDDIAAFPISLETERMKFYQH